MKIKRLFELLGTDYNINKVREAHKYLVISREQAEKDLIDNHGVDRSIVHNHPSLKNVNEDLEQVRNILLGKA